MDQLLLHRINQDWQNPALDWLMAVASSLPVWTPVFAVLAAILVWKYRWFPAISVILVIGLTIGAADGLIANNLKDAIARPRPHQVVYGLAVRDAADTSPRILALAQPATSKPTRPKRVPIDGQSMPSAHTMNLFAVCTAAVTLFGRGWCTLYLLAALVAYSRVYTGSHWPSDIPLSVTLGVLVGWLVPLATDGLWRRLAPRFFPATAERYPSLLPRRRSRIADGTNISDAATISTAHK